MIRLVCIDVDGTLIGASNTVSPAVWAAAERVRSRGIRLAICSGRPGFGVTGGYAQRLDPQGWHVFQNGASIVHLPTGASRSTPLAPELTTRLIARARQTGWPLEVYADAEYAIESSSELVRTHARLLGVPFVPRPLDSLPVPAVRAQWVVSDAEGAVILGEPADPALERSPSTSPLMPGVTFINLTPSGVSKASAVETLSTTYGVPLREVMFVGDSDNDAGAMRIVGYPIAMGNAEPAIRALARLIVGHVEEDGLVEALEAAIAP